VVDDKPATTQLDVVVMHPVEAGTVVTEYMLIGAKPSNVGTYHESEKDVRLKRVAVADSGAVATVVGLAPDDGCDMAPVPLALVAVTLKV